MNNSNDISDELRSMGSSLAGLSRIMPYQVSSGYFENLTGTIQSTIKELSKPDAVTGWGYVMPFQVPAGYFETLTDNIVAAATTQEVTQGLPKNIPFITPAGYFEALPAQMLKAVKAADVVTKETKIIPLKRRSLFTYTTVRWAAAAVLLICIGLGSYETFFKTVPANTDKILASVTPNDIQDYLQHTYRLDIDRIVGNNDINNLQIDNKDIIQYLDETGWDVVE